MNCTCTPLPRSSSLVSHSLYCNPLSTVPILLLYSPPPPPPPPNTLPYTIPCLCSVFVLSLSISLFRPRPGQTGDLLHTMGRSWLIHEGKGLSWTARDWTTPCRPSIYRHGKQMYITANGIEDDIASVLLTVIGAKTYGLLRSLLAPTLPQDKSYEELVTKLISHFSPKPIFTSEWFQFYGCKQRANESVAEFLADICMAHHQL